MVTGKPPYITFPAMKILMLILQNDPPTIETAGENTNKDQYKNYGKGIRKVIGDCLQKDPKKRPTATELLKYPFFRKAKDKKYLTETLLSNVPATRPTSSGRRRHGVSRSESAGENQDWTW
jgi:serine/threonine-protein kinase OSR1/STK39